VEETLTMRPARERRSAAAGCSHGDHPEEVRLIRRGRMATGTALGQAADVISLLEGDSRV